MNRGIAFWSVLAKDMRSYYIKRLSYALPLTYGADILHGAIPGTATMPYALGLAALTAFCVALFAVSLRNIQRKWIV